jgi:hypothetical protein
LSQDYTFKIGIIIIALREFFGDSWRDGHRYKEPIVGAKYSISNYFRAEIS